MGGLTARQEQVLAFIRESIRTNGYPPTVREICAALDLSSPSTVHAHLANLERQGLIKRDPSKPRALDLVRDLRPPRPLPLVGQVAAGVPLLAEENIEELVEVPGFLRRDDGDFVLRVSGDSMTDAGIFNGDLIVVHPQDDADSGDIVVALVGDEATTKRFYRDGRSIRLQPENELYEPIVLDRARSTSSARSWGCCAGYEHAASRHRAAADARRPARRHARRRSRGGCRSLRVVWRRCRRRGRRPVDQPCRVALPRLRQRARGRRTTAGARGKAVRADQTSRLRAVPVAVRSGPPLVQSARVGAHVRRARRARRVAGLLRFAVFLLLVFVAVWAGVRVANATVESTAFDGRAYEVQSGDTLWQIAVDEYGSSLDPRAVVFAIRDANGLDGASLQPGQVLTLPYLEE